MKRLLRSCVGIDVSKDGLQVCLSVIDTDQQVRIKSTTHFANQSSGFQALFKWAAKPGPVHLPLRYVMESTGVYHEQLAWYLYQQGQAVSILLPNKVNENEFGILTNSLQDVIDLSEISYQIYRPTGCVEEVTKLFGSGSSLPHQNFGSSLANSRGFKFALAFQKCNKKSLAAAPSEGSAAAREIISYQSVCLVGRR